MGWTDEALAVLNRSLKQEEQEEQRKARGRVREPKGMNKTERMYSAHLILEKRIGAIVHFGFEEITLKLADDTRFTPDFFVVTDQMEIQFHETKGFWRDDAKVKIKVAAKQFPFFTFMAIYKEPNGEWRQESF